MPIWNAKHRQNPLLFAQRVNSNGKCVSVDDPAYLPKDDDGYYYINTLERYIHCDTLHELHESEQYQRMRQCVKDNLSGYADRRVREKYIWLQKELDRMERNAALKIGKLIIR